MESIVERIRRMEAHFDRAEPADLKILAEYYDSGLWLSDYEADERGEIPKDLKRGVLSQDGLYDLLCSFREKSVGEGQ